jgi:hypothetical protein
MIFFKGGIYNRTFFSVRIEDWDPVKIEEMHNFFVKIKKNHKENKVQFSLIFPFVFNFLRKCFPGWFAKSGK